MLTGMIAPTSGDCSIHGYSILKNMKEIRKSVSIGVCPQTNCLFSKLTVKEHLELFATLKGVKPEELENEVETKIKEVGLEDKRDVYSSALSGGQQRRVQLSMAFIGGSKVVFLDESVQGIRNEITLSIRMQADAAQNEMLMFSLLSLLFSFPQANEWYGSLLSTRYLGIDSQCQEGSCHRIDDPFHG